MTEEQSVQSRRLVSARESYKAVVDGKWRPIVTSSRFVCPNCGAFAQHQWGRVSSLVVVASKATTSRICGSNSVSLALCTACEQESIFIDGALVHPQAIGGPAPDPDMPAEIREDFEEARSIVARSPRGASALLRLSIQKLCAVLGSTERDLHKAIGQLVKDGKIPEGVQQALDTVRVIGNDAVHPGTLDLNDDPDTAMALFGLVNFIVEKAIGDPKRIAEIYAKLPPSKLEAIKQRDANSKPPPAE